MGEESKSFLCGTCGNRVPDTGRDDWSADVCSDCHEAAEDERYHEALAAHDRWLRDQ